jgi:predicted nucleotidyltransferase
MLTQHQINEISNVFSQKAREIFGDKLKDAILFGSFAIGNASDESDIDIMLLVDLNRTDLIKYKNNIYKISAELGMQYNVLISPILQNIAEFNDFKNDLPFFKNVTLEGVRIGVQ